MEPRGCLGTGPCITWVTLQTALNRSAVDWLEIVQVGCPVVYKVNCDFFVSLICQTAGVSSAGTSPKNRRSLASFSQNGSAAVSDPLECH